MLTRIQGSLTLLRRIWTHNGRIASVLHRPASGVCLPCSPSPGTTQPRAGFSSSIPHQPSYRLAPPTLRAGACIDRCAIRICRRRRSCRVDLRGATYAEVAQRRPPFCALSRRPKGRVTDALGPRLREGSASEFPSGHIYDGAGEAMTYTESYINIQQRQGAHQPARHGGPIQHERALRHLLHSLLPLSRVELRGRRPSSWVAHPPAP